MTVENLKLFKKAGLLASSIVLSATLMAVPTIAYADEVTDDTKTESIQPANEQTTEKETKTETNVTFEGTYETENQANDKQTEKEAEYKEAGYENIESTITTTTTTEETGKIVEEYVNSTITTEEGAYTYDNEADANSKKEELESSADGHDVVITVEVNKNTVESGAYETGEVSETFNSEAEAVSYVDALKNDGYTVTDVNITQDSHEENVTLDQTYDSKNAAEVALSQFESTYNNVTSNGVTENKTDNVIETINGTTAYSEKSAAETALEEFLNDPNNETDEFYFTGTVVGPTGTGTYDTTQINETFNSEAEALTFLANLEDEGYTIVSYQFTKDTEVQTGSIEQKYGSMEDAEAALATFIAEYPNDVESNIDVIEAGTVYEAQTITEDMKIYQIGSTIFVIIKHGNEFFVWTEPQLTSEEIEQFKETFAELHTPHPVTGDNIASDHTQFVYGYNITYHAKNGKEFYFVLAEDNEILLVIDSGAESRVMYGEFEPVKQYVLTASGSKNVEKDSGTLTGEKQLEILGYYVDLYKKAKTYSVNASGTETILDDTYTLTAKTSKPIMVDEYVLDVITEEKHYKTYPETVEKTWYNLTVKANVPEKEITPEPEPKQEEKVVVEAATELPPTGDTNDMLPLTGLAGASLALAGFSLVKRRRSNRR